MKKLWLLPGLFCLSLSLSYSQDMGYAFTMKKEIACTPVKNQSASSTCWSFSSVSFFESELMRQGKKAFDLSEMFIVRMTYERKADEYARMHGSCSFSGGGGFHDPLKVMREDGLVPEEVYPGLNYGESKHTHGEMDAVLKGYMDGLIKGSKLTTAWKNGLNGILDAYLGTKPESFTYEGKLYTPVSFRTELALNPDDYVIFTSFSHHPFYTQFILEVPDNFAGGTCYNLPLDEFAEVIDYALNNGYSVAWASDMSDPWFSMKNGVAIVPVREWSDFNDAEKEKAFSHTWDEKTITQEMRQAEFNNYSTTDDHGMHIIGLATDQNGNTFYKVKNSWGITGKYDGFIYVSKPFVLLRTTNCMVNRNAIPPAIAKKMGLK